MARKPYLYSVSAFLACVGFVTANIEGSRNISDPNVGWSQPLWFQSHSLRLFLHFYLLIAISITSCRWSDYDVFLFFGHIKPVSNFKISYSFSARYFGANGVGIEIHPMRYLWCQIKITFLGLRRKVKIKYGDFFNYNLGHADVIFCYLLQSTNNKLEWKLLRETSNETRIVSNTFRFNMLQLFNMDFNSGIYVYGARLRQ